MKKLHILTLSMMLSTGFVMQSYATDTSDVDAMPMQEESASRKSPQKRMKNKKYKQCDSLSHQEKEYKDPASKSSKHEKKCDCNKKKSYKQSKGKSKKKLCSHKEKAVKTDAIITSDDQAVIQGRYY